MGKELLISKELPSYLHTHTLSLLWKHFTLSPDLQARQENKKVSVYRSRIDPVTGRLCTAVVSQLPVRCPLEHRSCSADWASGSAIDPIEPWFNSCSALKPPVLHYTHSMLFTERASFGRQSWANLKCTYYMFSTVTFHALCNVIIFFFNSN